MCSVLPTSPAAGAARLLPAPSRERPAEGHADPASSRLRAWFAAVFASLVLFACGASPALALPAVAVRVGTHHAYTRLVFELKRPVPFHVTRAGAEATVAFAAPLHFDLARLGAAKPRILAARTVTANSRTIVQLTLAKGMQLRYFPDGVHFVVDAVGPMPTRPQPALKVKPPKRQAAELQERAHEETRREAIERDKAGLKAAREIKETRTEGHARPENSRIPAAAAASPAAPVVTPPVLATAAGTVTVGVAMSGDRLRLAFPWPKPVAAAVFARAGWLWIVFDHPAKLDIAALAQRGMPAVWRAAQLADPKAAILRMRIGPAWAPVVSGSNSLWQVDLLPFATVTPPTSIPVQIEPAAHPLPQVFLAVPEAGERLALTDPAVGDRLTVVTVGKPGLGLAAPRSFAQFSLLRAAQGLAIVQASDHLRTVASPSGIAVTATGGLLLSTSSVGARAGHAGPNAMLQFGRRWAGPPERFEATKRQRQLALVQAPTGGLTDARYALAEFFFANGLYAESEGVLDRLVARAPIEATRSRFQLLHGAVLFGLRRFKDAAHELEKPSLARRPEAELWLGATLAAERDWKTALANLERGRAVLAAYPPAVRARFALAIAHAELGTGNPNGAQFTLTHLRDDHPDRATAAEADFLSGVAAERIGKSSEAEDYFHKAAASDVVSVEVRGKMALAELALEGKRINETEAIKRLEALRSTWRGGMFEDRLLRELGGLYLARHHYREALTTWRTVVTYFPQFPDTAEVKSRMQATFMHLFLNGGAEKLSALKAIGLFYDFRDLTPNNAQGDAIVRQLARRLVSVDLLSQAEDLLHYQMTYRLADGAEKARVGHQLGKVYLLDQQPKMTLAVLKESAATALPEPVLEERRNLEVAALIELDRYDDAIQALAGATDSTAEALRAGIYWRAHKWPEEVATLTQILGQRYANHAPLGADERLNVLRLAVALAMSGNSAALAQVHAEYAPLMVGTPQAEAFRAMTGKIGFANGLPAPNFIADLDQLQGFLTQYGIAPENAG